MTVDAQLLTDLRDPGAYPHAPRRVEVVQTHISCVFLAGDDVFKVKKAVRFSFLDFSTLARRRHFCEEEVRLNRRLAPDVYHGVVPIVRDAAGHRVGGDGEPVEYAVHMRRLPDEQLLRALLRRGEADTALMGRIAARIAAFHGSRETEPPSAAPGAPEEIRRTLEETLAGLAAHEESTIGATGGLGLADLRRLVFAALARVADTLRRRQDGGRVRDAHGDLRPDHICCTETLPIIDCVEFSARLRTCDVASEVAFLASELEFAGAPALAEAFVVAYVAASGDAGVPALLPFFRAYRALVRALVAAITATEPDIDAAARARQESDLGGYLALAARAAWRALGPFVVGVSGRSGSGKSTLASALAGTAGLALVRSDVVRKRLAGLGPLARPASAEEVNRLYSPAHTAAVYAAVAAEAERILADGRTVVVDATFLRRDDRERLRAVARATGATVLWIHCDAAPATIHARLRARAARDDDPSDATPAIADDQARRAEPFAADELPHLIVTTDEDPEPLATALRWLSRRLASPMDGLGTAC